jgi:CDP-6-deoxy-D-xylo-4-hexulose-3-dehydrase
MTSLLPLASTTWSDDEIEEAIKVLRSGKLTMGDRVRQFETQFAKYLGTQFAVMFNSGSSANLAMLAAVRLLKGHSERQRPNFLVPAVSWSTTFYPVNQADYELKFVDIDIRTLNMDVDGAKEAIDENTVGIFTVNLLGNPAGVTELRELASEMNILLLEDNCEALGAEVDGKKTGSFGLGGSHSFFFSHHMCTMEGGMVTTDDIKFYELMLSVRAHGWTRELPIDNTVFPKSDNTWEDLFRFVVPGFNLRPLELSGAIGSLQLTKLPDFVEQRRKNAKVFVELFQESEYFDIQVEQGKSSWFGFSVVLKPRFEPLRPRIIQELTEAGVDTRPIVAGNFTRNPVMKHLSYVPLPALPNADRVHDSGFFFGNHHFDISAELEKVKDLLFGIVSKS